MAGGRQRPSLRPAAWRDRPERARLLAAYKDADALLAGYTCDASTDCCRFGVTGREPYVTTAELRELEDAVRARGSRSPGKRRLEIAGERRCPMLSDEGKCIVYAARPLGCRTFFCNASLRKMGAKLPRAELARLAREVEDLSASAYPETPGTRPLTRVIG